MHVARLSTNYATVWYPEIFLPQSKSMGLYCEQGRVLKVHELATSASRASPPSVVLSVDDATLRETRLIAFKRLALYTGDDSI